MATSYTIERVTPEMAQAWLEASRGNRSIRHEVVANYAAQMLRGDWKPEADTVDFAKSGRLLNGHHRLLAVVVAEKPVKLAVRRGLDDDNLIAIDRGIKRSVADDLKFSGGQNVNQRASFLRGALRVIAGVTVPITDLETFNRFEATFKDALDWYIGSLAFKVPHMRSATVAGVFVAAYKMDPDAVRTFAERVKDGIGLVSGNPALTLRDFLITELAGGFRRRRSTPDAIRAKVASAIVAALDGRSLRVLQESSIALETIRRQYNRGAFAALLKESKTLRNEARSEANDWDFSPDAEKRHLDDEDGEE